MRTLAVLALLLLMPIVSSADQVQVSYSCTNPIESINISSGGDGGTMNIKSLEIPSVKNPEDFKVKLTVAEVTSTYPKESTEVYTPKELKSGHMLELTGSTDNNFSFDAVFLEFGDLDVATAGPIPPGTFNLKISMAFVDSNIYYKNSSPMTVAKVVFACKATVSY